MNPRTPSTPLTPEQLANQLQQRRLTLLLRRAGWRDIEKLAAKYSVSNNQVLDTAISNMLATPGALEAFFQRPQS